MDSKQHWNYRVLIVDDEDGIHRDFKDMLSRTRAQALTDQLAENLLDEVSENKTSFLPNFELVHATSGEEAYDIVRAGKDSNCPIAVAYIDVRMPPGIDGVEAIRRIRKIEKDIELVIMTAYSDKPLPEIVRDMELLHKLLYIRKPFVPEEVQQITLALIQKWNVERELANKQQQIISDHYRLETILDSTDDAIGMFDDEGYLLFANQRYQQLFDLTEEQLRQMPPDELQTLIKARFQTHELLQLGQAPPIENLENIVEAFGESGTSAPRIFYRSIAPVRNDQGDSAGNVVSYHDMSKDVEIQQMKSEVLRLRAELESVHSIDEIIGKSQNMRLKVILACLFQVKAGPAKNWWRAQSTPIALVERSRLFQSIAPPFRKH